MNRTDAIKFAGLVAFVVVCLVAVVALWPSLADVFSEGGVERLVESAQGAGWAGMAMLEGVQLLQVVVAFLPGEVVQVAAGLMYGPWLGSLLILVGAMAGSTAIYFLVHKLGAPFVQGMVSTRHLGKFQQFEKSGKLDAVVFFLFLFPGMPKDVFTYLVPLTGMSYRRFITLTSIGRIPGVVGSTYAASGLANGDIVGPAIVVGLLVVLAILAAVFSERIMNVLANDAVHAKERAR